MYTLDNVDRLIMNITGQLITNQNLLKCLKYPYKDAINRADLSQSEINALMDNSNPQEVRLSFTPFNLTTPAEEKSELRIYIGQFKPEFQTLSQITLIIQVIVSNNLWIMDDGRNRPLIIVSEILKSLNDKDVEMVGLIDQAANIRIFNYNDHFSGYELNLRVRSA